MMKFFKSKADINQSLDIVVPSAEIEEQVKLKLAVGFVAQYPIHD